MKKSLGCTFICNIIANLTGVRGDFSEVSGESEASTVEELMAYMEDGWCVFLLGERVRVI
jgi:hypothetical protein